MIFFRRLILLAFVATPMLAAAQSTVLAELQTCDDDARKCLSQCKAYSGGIAGAVVLNQCLSKLEDDLKKASSDVHAAPVLTDGEAQQICEYISDTLIPDIKTLLTCIKNKKPLYQSAGLTGTMKSELQNFKSAGDDFFKVLIVKGPASSQSCTQTAATNFDAAADDAITYYS